MDTITPPIGGPRPGAEVRSTEAAPPVRQPPREAPAPARAPRRDEYVPETPREPSGRYWPGRDAEGQPGICFDGPAREDGAPRQPEVPRAEERKAERCTCDTDEVDREIRRLKERQASLEQALRTQTDQRRTRQLERELEQVERELRQKDNDAYRRRHAQFS